MAVRYFELGLQFFMRRGYRLVFLFDEFEELMRQMPIKFFQNLRGLRDTYKNQLAYLTFTRTPLKAAAQQLGLPSADFEAFQELFTDSTYYVGPYNEADARHMLQELTTRSGKRIPELLATHVIHLTGGYAGLLRSSFTLIDPTSYQAAVDDDALAQFLLSKNPIRAECRTLWSSLSPPEKLIMKAVARLAAYDVNPETEQAIIQLLQKRVLRLDKGSQKLEIHPPLFRMYIAMGREEV
jgi:hypothetical protein